MIFLYLTLLYWNVRLDFLLKLCEIGVSNTAMRLWDQLVLHELHFFLVHQQIVQVSTHGSVYLIPSDFLSDAHALFAKFLPRGCACNFGTKLCWRGVLRVNMPPLPPPSRGEIFSCSKKVPNVWEMYRVQEIIYIGRRPCYICLLPNGNRDDSDGSLEQCRIHIILECRLLPPCHTICVIGWLNGWIIISTSSTATTPQYMCDVGSESSASSL